MDRFDESAFQISRSEANEMDPQQRLALRTVLSALREARLPIKYLAGSDTGVYVGAGIAEHMAFAFGSQETMTKHTMSGNCLSVIANRISYFLDLRGPSMCVDTACSSSLTALSLAVDSLRSGRSKMAIVVGVNTLLSSSPFVGFSQAGMLSPTGTSRPFGKGADGFVRAEGCGVVILAHPDHIPVWCSPWASVLAVKCNEDGRTCP